MANNVAITPGLGASVMTEEQGGVHAQVMLLGHRLTTPLSEVAVNVSSSGDNTIVSAGGAGVKHRVYKFFLENTSTTTDVSVKWKDGAGADFHPAILLLKNGGAFILDFDSVPWFTGTAATALILNLSAAVQVSGRAYYVSAT